MDFQNEMYRPAPPNKLAVASMITGIAAIPVTFVVPLYLPLILGSISITLAFLSKGYNQKLHANALTGVITSLSSIFLNVVVVGISFYLVFCVPEYREMFNDACEQLYGETFDEMIEGELP